MLALRLIGLGWYVGISIFLGVAFGLWLDSQFQSVLFVFLGLFLGLAVAAYGVYRLVVSAMKEEQGKD